MISSNISTVNDVRKFVDGETSTVAIYLPQYTVLKGMMLLAKKMIAQGYKVAFLIEPNLFAYMPKGLDFVFAIDKTDVEKIDFVDVFITLYDATHYSDKVKLPQKPILVACNHSFDCIPPGTDPKSFKNGIVGRAREFDYYVSDSARSLEISSSDYEEWAHKVLGPNDQLRGGDSFSVLPAGYFNYDASIEFFENIEEKPYNLFYTHKRGDGRWRYEREDIVTTLLDNFDTPVVYSSGPFEWVYPDRMEMIERYADRKNFDLGKEKVHLNSFAKALICLTSDSDTVLTFGIATLRPFIRCNFTHAGTPEEKPIERHEFGYDVYSPAQLKEAVATLLEELEQSDGTLIERQKYEAYTPNPGKSCEKFIEYLPYILRGEQHPEWITFALPKNPKGPGWAPLENRAKAYPVVEKPHSLALEMHYDEEQDYMKMRSRELDVCDQLFSSDGPTFMIWGGSGGYLDNFREQLLNSQNNCLGFIDRNETLLAEGLDGYDVYRSESIPELKPEYLIIASTYHAEIAAELLSVLEGA